MEARFNLKKIASDKVKSYYENNGRVGVNYETKNASYKAICLGGVIGMEKYVHTWTLCLPSLMKSYVNEINTLKTIYNLRITRKHGFEKFFFTLDFVKDDKSLISNEIRTIIKNHFPKLYKNRDSVLTHRVIRDLYYGFIKTYSMCMRVFKNDSLKYTIKYLKEELVGIETGLKNKTLNYIDL